MVCYALPGESVNRYRFRKLQAQNVGVPVKIVASTDGVIGNLGQIVTLESPLIPV